MTAEQLYAMKPAAMRCSVWHFDEGRYVWVSRHSDALLFDIEAGPNRWVGLGLLEAASVMLLLTMNEGVAP